MCACVCLCVYVRLCKFVCAFVHVFKTYANTAQESFKLLSRNNWSAKRMSFRRIFTRASSSFSASTSEVAQPLQSIKKLNSNKYEYEVTPAV